MKPRILLANPPIYDFAAYDFWLKPYGLLSVAGYLREKVDVELFDYLDRLHPFEAKQKNLESDRWGRGRFYCTIFQAVWPAPELIHRLPHRPATGRLRPYPNHDDLLVPRRPGGFRRCPQHLA